MKLRCRLCRSKYVRKIDRQGQYSLFRCQNCDVVFVNHKLSLKQIEEKNIRKYGTAESQQIYIRMKSIFYDRAEKCVKRLKKYLVSGKLLDIGCGYGFYMQIFQKYGYACFGIDISSNIIRYAKKNLKLNVKKGNFNTSTFNKKSFQVVTAFDILEHFSSPRKVMKQIYDILDDKGILIIQTPNYDSLMLKLTGLKWYWLLIPQHLFIYNLFSLKYLLNKYNFSILKISTWDDSHEFIKNILDKYKINEKTINISIYKTLLRTRFIINLFSRVWNLFHFGGEMLIYAQKKY